MPGRLSVLVFQFWRPANAVKHITFFQVCFLDVWRYTMVQYMCLFYIYSYTHIHVLNMASRSWHFPQRIYTYVWAHPFQVAVMMFFADIPETDIGLLRICSRRYFHSLPSRMADFYYIYILHVQMIYLWQEHIDHYIYLAIRSST